MANGRGWDRSETMNSVWNVETGSRRRTHRGEDIGMVAPETKVDWCLIGRRTFNGSLTRNLLERTWKQMLSSVRPKSTRPWKWDCCALILLPNLSKPWSVLFLGSVGFASSLSDKTSHSHQRLILISFWFTCEQPWTVSRMSRGKKKRFRMVLSLHFYSVRGTVDISFQVCHKALIIPWVQKNRG